MNSAGRLHYFSETEDKSKISHAKHGCTQQQCCLGQSHLAIPAETVW